MTGEADHKSAATVLVELACERYELGVSSDGEAFGVPIMGNPVVRLLRGGRRGLRAELAREYFGLTGKAAPQQALADALLVLEGMACGTDPVPLARRVAGTTSGWWIDLGDDTGDAIRVDRDGWKITFPPAGLRFARSVLTGALPRPVHGGDLAELWRVLNVAEPDRPVVLAWLVAAMVADIPHPILSLAGEQGTGKSTAARVIGSLLDPGPVPLRKAPRDAESWVTAAAGSWIVALDNMSAVSDWLSDTLCRAVTGDGDVRRQLYSDGGLHVFAFRRCVILTAVDLGALRGDLADRLLVIDLDVIPDRARQLDATLEAHWQTVQPGVLGALLDLAASVASVLPSVRLDRYPRMADFARVLAAVDQVQGSTGLNRYLGRARTLAADALTADPFVVAMHAKIGDQRFDGTSAELLARVPVDDERRPPKGWPANARQLTSLLRRQGPVMRRAGWQITELPPGHDNALRWDIRRPEKDRKQDSQDSQRSRDITQQTPAASDASLASVQYGQTQDDRTTEGAHDKPAAVRALDLLGREIPAAQRSCPACGARTAPSRNGHQTLCRPCTLAELKDATR